MSMKPLSLHKSFMIKLRQMKYTKVVLELRDSCLKSNYMHKTVQMTQLVLQEFSWASTSTINYQKSLKEIKMETNDYLFSSPIQFLRKTTFE